MIAFGAGLSVLAQAGGCMALSPQLPPTDFAALEQVESRQEREQLYAENQIYQHSEPQGVRYTKGTSTSATKRSWQSLDAILRSDQNSSAALPIRQQRLARLFTALTIVAGIVTVAGAAASAREGLNLGDLNGTGGLMLGGGLATVGFGIASGIFFGKTRKGYEAAVDIYNDSLGMRLGILDGNGKYIPARGTLLDDDGNIVLDPRVDDVDEPEPEPTPDVTAPESEAPAEPEPDDPVEAPTEASPETPAEEPTAEEPTAAEEPTTAEEPTAEEPTEDATPGGVARLRLSPRQ